MAARLRKHHQDDIRKKIAASLRVSRLARFMNSGLIYEAKPSEVASGQQGFKKGTGGGGQWRLATKDDAPIIAQRLRVAFEFLKKIVPDVHEVSGPDGGPIRFEFVDVTAFTDDELDALAAGRATRELLARVAAAAKGGSGAGAPAPAESEGAGMEATARSTDGGV